MDLSSTLNRICLLHEFRGEKKVVGSTGTLRFDWHVNGRDEATLDVNPQTGKCIIFSYSISYHNGDSYDLRQEELAGEATEAVLTKLLQRSEREALEYAKHQVGEDQARDRLNRFLSEDAILNLQQMDNEPTLEF